MGFNNHSSCRHTRARQFRAVTGLAAERGAVAAGQLSANWKPALWRVRAYSVPGLPSPTISLSGSPAMSLSHTANVAGRRRSAMAPAAAGVWCSACRGGYFLPPSFLAGAASFFSCPSWPHPSWPRRGRPEQRPGPPQAAQRPERREHLQRQARHPRQARRRRPPRQPARAPRHAEHGSTRPARCAA